MATTAVITCIIAVIITFSMTYLWLKNKLSRKHIVPLQASYRGLSLPSPIELDTNKAYSLQPVVHVSENEAYATTLAHRIKDTTAKQ